MIIPMLCCEIFRNSSVLITSLFVILLIILYTCDGKDDKSVLTPLNESSCVHFALKDFIKLELTIRSRNLKTKTCFPFILLSIIQNNENYTHINFSKQGEISEDQSVSLEIYSKLLITHSHYVLENSFNLCRKHQTTFFSDTSQNMHHKGKSKLKIKTLEKCRKFFCVSFLENLAYISEEKTRKMYLENKSAAQRMKYSKHKRLQNFISRKIFDIFISYRRSNGSHLASLIKLYMEIKGYSVFLDVHGLKSGDFHKNIMDVIKTAKNFVLILSPNALDRCKNGNGRKDWMHKEIVTALESSRNIIPVIDNFKWPDASDLPQDMVSIRHYNSVKWVHEYQEACISKIEKFMMN